MMLVGILCLAVLHENDIFRIWDMQLVIVQFTVTHPLK